MGKIDELRAKRDAADAKANALVAAAKTEARTLTDAESQQFTELAERIAKLNGKIAAEETEARQKAEDAQRSAAAAAVAANPAAVAAGEARNEGGIVVRSEPMTYEAWKSDLRNGGTSYLLDTALVAAAKVDGNYSGRAAEAAERLQRHQKEVDVEVRGMSRSERAAFDEFLGRSDVQGSYEKRVNPNTTAGTGGEFVPPLWLVGQYAPFKRATRTFANRCVNMPLPPGIDIINVPKITTGTLTAPQGAQGGAVASQDVVTSTVSAAVRTISGQGDISLQLLEQSPIAMDGVMFQDLSRDYDKQLDTAIISGNGTTTVGGGTHLGVLSIASQTVALNTVNSAFTSQIPASSTVFNDQSTTATQFRAIVNGKNQIESLYFDAASAIWVHPRRANSWEAAADTQGRPLFTVPQYGTFNAYGNEQPNQAQGVAGYLSGLPVVKDANMPTTCNGFTGTANNLTGGTQDPIIVLDESQLWLWESSLKLRALPEVLSGTLQIRFQVYAYSAFMANRFPTAISVLLGAGVAAPTF